MCEMVSESCLVMVLIRRSRSFTSAPYYYGSHSSPRAGLTRRPSSRIAADREMTNLDRVSCVVERLQHGAADAARRVVVLHNDHAVPGRSGRIEERLRVDRLHRVQVHHPGTDAVALQL